MSVFDECWEMKRPGISNVNERLYPELYALCKKNKTFDGPNWKKEKTKKELFDEYMDSKKDY